jgi:purine nucleosidase
VPSSSTGRPIIIDTDPGIDDALAILLALASPELDVRALVTVAGNVRLELTTRNALKLRELGKRLALPVYAGCNRPIARDLITGIVHGTTGMDGADLPTPKGKAEVANGVDWLIETLSQAKPKSQTLLPIGPLTNIATAFKRAPGIAQALRDVVIMGGATPKIGGNISPHAEFNIFVDPEAADFVFGLGLPITLVPLDLSHQMVVTMERIARIAAIPGPVGTALGGMLRFYHDGDEYLHDPLTVAWLLKPELFSGKRAAIRVETRGERSGETVFDWREDGPCNVLLQGDHMAFFDFLIGRLERLAAKG